MASQEDGFATASLELLSGYPAYFYLSGDGEYITALDDKYGLPLNLAGDFNPDGDWIYGFNRGVIAHIEKHGVPWNSRLSSRDVLSDLPDFFCRRISQSRRLNWNGKALKPDGFGYTLTLENGPAGISIGLETNSLFDDPEIVPGAMAAYRSGPPPGAAPPAPLPPLLKAGSRLVWLQFFDGAQSVECVPAPLGSHLVVFRFSDFAPSSWRSREAQECFAALDTQLARWIPGTLMKWSPEEGRADG